MQSTTRYGIRHVTRFRYDSPVSESVMEVRMRPATSPRQRCLQFALDVQPRATVFDYRDHHDNWVYHFDIPGRHGELVVTASSQVEVDEPLELPRLLPLDSWGQIDEWIMNTNDWDFRQPSLFTAWTNQLLMFESSLPGRERLLDPLGTVRAVMAAIHAGLEYVPYATRVDSSIDDVLAARKGVCQDFSHVMIAVLRRLELPCRYVSGYLAPEAAGQEAASGPIATHAWVEVHLPDLGWIGVDPTNNTVTGARHIRVAVGRDYADVPPTRGVFKGGAASSLSVAVELTTSPMPPPQSASQRLPAAWTASVSDIDARRAMQQQEQQQQ